MNAAVRGFFEEFRDGRILADRLQQLDFRVRQLDEDDVDAVLRLGKRSTDLRAKGVSVNRCSLFEVFDRDSDMVQTSDHASFSVAARVRIGPVATGAFSP